ncbi:MAG: NBR1-Ig-like domain-containing protein, partial [Armatimonadota bacterium]|nr:NBR1-Ig-like domain-containing protein [Armatimonadota bacterium]
SHWEGNDHDPPDDVSSCFYPVLGAYSSMDKAAIEKQMEWIKRSGIGVALLDVWTIGGETEIPVMTSMDIAASKGIRCGFYLEPYHVGADYRTINDVESQIHYLYDTYGSHPAAYKISRPTQWGPSSAPRMVFYSFNSFANITEADWAAYMDRARNTAYDPFLVGQPGSPGTMTNCHWDGLTPYDGFSVDPIYFASRNIDITNRGGVFSPVVTPGYDDTCGAGGDLVMDRQNGATYDSRWTYAKNAAPEFISITSFNEWHESTQIEPAQTKTVPGLRVYQDYGSLDPNYYLDRTMYWKNQWKGNYIENAAYMADGMPSTMQPGETRDVSVVMMNTGDTTWTNAGGYKLGGYGDSDPFAGTRHEVDSAASVASFETYTFTFPFTAPSTPGTYHTDWQMVHESVRWFGEIKPYKDIVVSTAGGADNAQYISDTIPSTMAKGQQYTVSITMKNTGTTTWGKTAGWRLGAVGDSDHFAGTRQNALVDVLPNSTVTYTFVMTAPDIIGYYTTDWRMIHAGVDWLGQEFKKIVLVTDPVGIPPVTGFTAVGGNQQIALSWTNPADYDFTRVMVRYKTDGYPTGPADGTLLVDKLGAPEANDGCVHTGIANGSTYYYAAFAHDGIGNYAATGPIALSTAWNTPWATLLNNTFNSNADGWSIATWKAGSSGAGAMAWNSAAGNPGGGMRSTGYSSTDDANRCNREGGEIYRTISTAGYRNITVSYNLRVNTLGNNNTGEGTGTCQTDHNLIDEQLTVYYSTDDGANWKEADWVSRGTLRAIYQTYGTRQINLSGLTGCDNNANFALRFRWQLNTSSDRGELDNIMVKGLAIDAASTGTVTGFTAISGNREAALSWTNPSDSDFTAVTIVYKTDSYPTAPTDGTLVIDKTGAPPSNSDGYVHTGLTNGTTYYYSAFARDSIPNYAAAANANTIPADIVPPGPVAGFAAAPWHEQNTLSWTNPADSDFVFTMVRFKTTGYPISETDGDLAFNKANAPGSGDNYIHTGLANGATYYYRAFSCDTANNYNTSASITASAMPETGLLWMNETFDQRADGNLGGQGNWTSQVNNAQIQSSFAKNGKAALLDSAATGSTITNSYQGFTKKASGYHYITFDVAQSCAGTSGSVYAYIYIYADDSSIEIAKFRCLYNMWQFEGAGTQIISFGVNQNTWYNVRIGFDVNQQKFDVWLDGVSKLSGAAWKGTGSNISRIVISSERKTGLTAQKFYIDNLRGETRPAAPVLTDDGVYTGSLSKLHCSWNPGLAEITKYRYALGTTSGGTDVAPWTLPLTSADVTLENLTLSENKTYYFSAQAGTQYDSWSLPGVSDGITTPQGVTIQGAKALTDGQIRAIRGKVVSCVFDEGFYIQDPGGFFGLRVQPAAAVAVGQLVDIAGVIGGAHAERFINLTGNAISSSTGPGSPPPIALGASALGGDELNDLTPGVTGGVGLNNIGLLVRTWGRVTEVDPSGNYFRISDGSKQIKILSESLAEPSGEPYVVITGICVRDISDGEPRAAVRPRTQADIIIY